MNIKKIIFLASLASIPSANEASAACKVLLLTPPSIAMLTVNSFQIPGSGILHYTSELTSILNLGVKVEFHDKYIHGLSLIVGTNKIYKDGLSFQDKKTRYFMVAAGYAFGAKVFEKDQGYERKYEIALLGQVDYLFRYDGLTNHGMGGYFVFRQYSAIFPMVSDLCLGIAYWFTGQNDRESGLMPSARINIMWALN